MAFLCNRNEFFHLYVDTQFVPRIGHKKVITASFFFRVPLSLFSYKWMYCRLWRGARNRYISIYIFRILYNFAQKGIRIIFIQDLEQNIKVSFCVIGILP